LKRQYRNSLKENEKKVELNLQKERRHKRQMTMVGLYLLAYNKACKLWIIDEKVPEEVQRKKDAMALELQVCFEFTFPDFSLALSCSKPTPSFPSFVRPTQTRMSQSGRPLLRRGRRGGRNQHRRFEMLT